MPKGKKAVKGKVPERISMESAKTKMEKVNEGVKILNDQVKVIDEKLDSLMAEAQEEGTMESDLDMDDEMVIYDLEKTVKDLNRELDAILSALKITIPD